MPQTSHVEKHFTASEAVRDIVIGMSDGLTVPFALAVGLSGAVEATGIIITAGLAENAHPRLVEAPSCFGPSLQRSPKTGGGPRRKPQDYLTSRYLPIYWSIGGP